MISLTRRTPLGNTAIYLPAQSVNLCISIGGDGLVGEQNAFMEIEMNPAENQRQRGGIDSLPSLSWSGHVSQPVPDAEYSTTGKDTEQKECPTRRNLTRVINNEIGNSG